MLIWIQGKDHQEEELYEHQKIIKRLNHKKIDIHYVKN